MTQHEQITAVRVVPRYELDTLGAPFKVVLLDVVTLGVDPATGDETVKIPDLVGLIGAVIRTRVSHVRKLSGTEIKFVRVALDVHANRLAAFLDMSPEHLSRCEAGTKVMSAGVEKIFRLFAFAATYFNDAEELLVRAENASPKENGPKPDKFLKAFLAMKVQSAFDPAEELQFEFVRTSPTTKVEDDAWEPPTKKAA